MALSNEVIAEFLALCGVSTETWKDNPEALSVTDLMTELKKGESSLSIARVCRVVSLHIVDPQCPERGVLMEISQRRDDGKSREINQRPAEKFGVTEAAVMAVKRGMQEELNLGPDQYSYSYMDTTTERRESSRSYPGLPTVYELYNFRIAVKPGAYILEKEQFEVYDEQEKATLLFKWVPQSQS